VCNDGVAQKKSGGWGIMIEMRVDNLSEPNSGQEVVWLRSLDGRVLVPIEIGHTEWLSIWAEVTGERLPRPLTHDLLRTLLTHFDAEIEEVQVVDFKENIFYAELVLSSGGKQVRFDARPSDCIALALKFGAPIFMDGKIIQEVGYRTKERHNSLELEPLNPSVEDIAAEVELDVPNLIEGAVDDLITPTEDAFSLPGDDIDPGELLTVLKEQMQKAVIEERYEDAGMIRDEIERIEMTKQSL
jgi:bifunctional DNase/RNase